MFHRIFPIVLLLAALAASASDELEGDQLYRVSTVRAAPGALSGLLDWAAPKNTRDFHVLRHSQGDHWDLMFVTAMNGMSLAPVFGGAEHLIAFQEDTFAYGPAASRFAAAYGDNALYHIEMFAALPGKTAELLEQRRMENAYLSATGQTTNMIFRGVAGTDVDVFTIGFHENLEAFAAPSPASPEESEAAARAAGFRDRADISFYLRSLLAGHHDTLAVKVE